MTSKSASPGTARAIRRWIVGVRFRWPFCAAGRPAGRAAGELAKRLGFQEVAAVDFPVLDFSGRLDEAAGAFMDTAAVIGGLDLVVTTDTVIVHLAGALARRFSVRSNFAPLGLASRPRRLALVSDHAALPPNRVRSVAGRLRPHYQSRPGVAS